jgi:hypothetical protein
MSRPPDHYKALGISPDATPQAVRDAYRRLARTYHPDRYEGKGDSGATMARINQAYEVLSDPQSRRAYDESIAPPPQVPPAFAGGGSVRFDLARHKPWLLLWVVLSIVILALGWVALKTLAPAPGKVVQPATVQQVPVDHPPLAPVPAIEPWKPPPPPVRAGLPETEPVARLIRDGVLHSPARRQESTAPR